MLRRNPALSCMLLLPSASAPVQSHTKRERESDCDSVRLDDLMLQLSTCRGKSSMHRVRAWWQTGRHLPSVSEGRRGERCVVCGPATACTSHHLRRSTSSDGSEVGVKICGAELGAMYSDVEVPATSIPPRMPCCVRPGISEPRSVAPRHVTLAP